MFFPSFHRFLFSMYSPELKTVILSYNEPHHLVTEYINDLLKHTNQISKFDKQIIDT